jgi:hypothetical protein
VQELSVAIGGQPKMDLLLVKIGSKQAEVASLDVSALSGLGIA